MRVPRPLPVKSLPARIRLSLVSVVKLLYLKPAYFLLAATVSIVFYQFIFWFLNLGLLQYLLTSPFLTIGDKLELLIGSYSGVFRLPISPLAITLFAVSVIQGITVAALVYTVRRERLMQRGLMKDFGGTGIAGALSVLGLGCAACGTSLVTPILTFFFTTSSAAVAEEIGLYSAVLALVVSLVTVYLAGLRLSSRLTM